MISRAILQELWTHLSKKGIQYKYYFSIVTLALLELQCLGIIILAAFEFMILRLQDFKT